MAHDYLSEKIFLRVGVVRGAYSDVSQFLLPVSQYEREKLLDIIRDNIQNSPVKLVKTLVFVENKETADLQPTSR